MGGGVLRRHLLRGIVATLDVLYPCFLHHAMIHVEPIVLMARKFADGDEWGDEYKAVLTVQKTGDTAHCVGCHGKFTMRDYRELKKELAKHGIENLTWDRMD